MIKKKIRLEIENLINQLHTEKQEDLYLYKLKMQDTSLVERRLEGVCWYPVQLEKTNYDAGERLLVKVSRNSEHNNSHLFQSGKLVSLFSNSNNNTEAEDFVSGVVNKVTDNEMLITINSDEFPEWINDGKLGVQLLFDENSYKEMDRSLNYLLKTDNEQIINLTDVILGDSEAAFLNKFYIDHPRLNQSQNKAVNLILNAQSLGIVHGPPGTGKTTTLVHGIEYTLKEEKQVLVCAPSNTAVDLLVEKLSERDINVVRIGHPARVDDAVLKSTLDFKITHHENYKDVRMLKKKTEEFYKMAGKYRRNFTETERQQRREFYAEARKLKEETKYLTNYIISNVLSDAQVIASTMVGAGNVNIRGLKFKTVFLDETAQSLEPAAWIPILKAERVIMAGDHNQLPPTIKSYEAAKNGLEVTLFEKAIKRNSADVMLQMQYRMNKKIMSFSSDFFYNNQLIANENVENWKIFENDTPVEFVDTAGTGFEEKIDEETKSTYNPEEVNLLFKHFVEYIKNVEQNTNIGSIQDIGIISPYRAQVKLMQHYFDEYLDINEDLKSKITVNTIDSFQGQEKDIIYISLVRSNEKGEIGFLSDIRRMNVAMTRARKKLVVIGDSGTICRNNFYNKFVDYINEIDAYKSAFEFLY